MHSYQITSWPAELGGGWELRLFQDGIEVGREVFPIERETADPYQDMAWWTSLADEARNFWLKLAESARPADAYRTFLRVKAHDKAVQRANVWQVSGKA